MNKYDNLKGCYATLKTDRLIFTDKGFQLSTESSNQFTSEFYKYKDNIIRNSSLPKWCIKAIDDGKFVHILSVILTDDKYVMVVGNVVNPEPIIKVNKFFKYEYGYNPGEPKIKSVREIIQKKTYIGVNDGDNLITKSELKYSCVNTEEETVDYKNPHPEMVITPIFSISGIEPAKYNYFEYASVKNKEYKLETIQRIVEQKYLEIRVDYNYPYYSFDENTKTWYLKNYEDYSNICYSAGDNINDKHNNYLTYMNEDIKNSILEFLKNNPKEESIKSVKSYNILSCKLIDEHTTIDHSNYIDSDDGMRRDCFTSVNRRYSLSVNFDNKIKDIIYNTQLELEEF